jgi:hypothetical protein
MDATAKTGLTAAIAVRKAQLTIPEATVISVSFLLISETADN